MTEKKSTRRRTYGGPWTPEEDELFRTLYPACGVDSCLPSFPGRTRESLMSRAKHLHLVVTKETRARLIAESRAERKPSPTRKPETEQQVPAEYIQAADIFQVGYRVAQDLGVVHEFA